MNAPLDRLLDPTDQKRVLDRIAAIERESSGEVRVHISDRRVRDPLAAAQKTFKALNMTRTRRRNGVLVFLSLPARRFAIVGDEGLSSVVDPEFWQELCDGLGIRFTAGNYAEGLLEVLGRVEAVLVKYFPYEEGDVDELADDISYAPPRRRALPWLVVGAAVVTAALLYLAWRLFYGGWS